MGVAGLFAINEYYSPRLYYRQLPFYTLGRHAVTSCLVTNHGQKKTTAPFSIGLLFSSEIIEIHIKKKHKYKILSGGKNTSGIVIEFPELLPQQLLYVVVEVEKEQSAPFVDEIFYERGRAKEGYPIFTISFFAIITTSIFVLSLLGFLGIKAVPSIKSSKGTFQKNRIAQKAVTFMCLLGGAPLLVSLPFLLTYPKLVAVLLVFALAAFFAINYFIYFIGGSPLVKKLVSIIGFFACIELIISGLAARF